MSWTLKDYMKRGKNLTSTISARFIVVIPQLVHCAGFPHRQPGQPHHQADGLRTGQQQGSTCSLYYSTL